MILLSLLLWGYKNAQPHTAFFHGCKKSNSDLHTSQKVLLPTKPSHQLRNPKSLRRMWRSSKKPTLLAALRGIHTGLLTFSAMIQDFIEGRGEDKVSSLVQRATVNQESTCGYEDKYNSVRCSTSLIPMVFEDTFLLPGMVAHACNISTTET